MGKEKKSINPAKENIPMARTERKENRKEQ